MANPDQAKPIILIGSEKPGTGLSTVSDLLAKALGFEIIEASMFRRAIASHWEFWQIAHGDNDASWSEFVSIYIQKYSGTPNLDQLADLYQDLSIFEEKASDTSLKAFNQKARYELLFDTLPERLLTYYLTLPTDKKGFIVSGKLSPILDELVQTNFGICLVGNIIGRFLFTASDAVSAERVLQRESKLDPNLTLTRVAENNAARIANDWERYPQVFSIEDERGDKRPLSRQDLDRPDIHHIDTSEMTPEEALFQILVFIIKDAPEFAVPFIQSLETLNRDLLIKLIEEFPTAPIRTVNK